MKKKFLAENICVYNGTFNSLINAQPTEVTFHTFSFKEFCWQDNLYPLAILVGRENDVICVTSADFLHRQHCSDDKKKLTLLVSGLISIFVHRGAVNETPSELCVSITTHN